MTSPTQPERPLDRVRREQPGDRAAWRPRRASILPALLVPFACLALYGCPDDETTEDDAAGTPEGYEDVVYEGGTTDEALVAFVAALDQGAPQPDTTQAPLLTSPMAGELPATPIPTFSFQLGSSASAATPRDVRVVLRSTPDWGDALQLLGARARQSALVGPLAELLGPPRAARAHGDPFNGYGYFMTIKSSADPKLCRVFTGATSFTPSSEVWSKISAAGEVTVELVGAAFENNRIPSGGGPFLGSTTNLTITP